MAGQNHILRALATVVVYDDVIKRDLSVTLTLSCDIL